MSLQCCPARLVFAVQLQGWFRSLDQSCWMLSHWEDTNITEDCAALVDCLLKTGDLLQVLNPSVADRVVVWWYDYDVHFQATGCLRAVFVATWATLRLQASLKKKIHLFFSCICIFGNTYVIYMQTLNHPTSDDSVPWHLTPSEDRQSGRSNSMLCKHAA